MTLGDFSAKVVNEKVSGVPDGQGLCERNNRGNKSKAWVESRETIIVNTWLKHHPRRL